LVFLDWGGVRRNNPGPAEITKDNISSTGIGIRFSRGTNFALRADWAVVVNAGGTQQTGNSRVHFSLSYVF
jgi:hemolysin activation/secretion protein